MEPAVLSLAGASVLGATDGSTVSLSVASWLRLGGEVALHRAAPSPLRGRDRSASSRRSRRLSPRSLSRSASSLSLPGRRSPSRSPRPDLRPRSLSRPRSRTPPPGRPGQRSPTPPVHAGTPPRRRRRGGRRGGRRVRARQLAAAAAAPGRPVATGRPVTAFSGAGSSGTGAPFTSSGSFLPSGPSPFRRSA